MYFQTAVNFAKNPALMKGGTLTTSNVPRSLIYVTLKSLGSRDLKRLLALTFEWPLKAAKRPNYGETFFSLIPFRSERRRRRGTRGITDICSNFVDVKDFPI